jgi:hypothetical protein
MFSSQYPDYLEFVVRLGYVDFFVLTKKEQAKRGYVISLCQQHKWQINK